ncbi:hypothetical protein FRC03_005392 [Tulasnella sp. 419]|nr:hypothetical protein FRC03_005392 [Tulasnella sp. 419]
MVKYLGVVASIQVDGVDLPEYQVVFDDNKKTVQCFVPAKVGNEYAIRIARDTGTRKKTALRCHTLFDGSQEHVKCRTISLNRDYIVIDYVRESATTCRPLVFAELATTDDDNFITSASAVDTGGIRIDIQRVQVTRAKNSRLPYESRASGKHLKETVVVHERSKKAGGTRTSLGALRTTAEATQGIPRHHPYSLKDEVPFVSFIFLHRTEAMLKAREIIPGSPPPIDICSSDDDEDVEEQKAQVRALEAKLDAARSKLSSSKQKGAREETRVKVEIRPHQAFPPNEIVDMTHL